MRYNMANRLTGSVILTVLVTLHRAASFGIPDFLNLERSLVARDTSNEDQVLVNAVIDVGLRMADTDGNGVVTLAEVGNCYDRILNQTSRPGYESSRSVIDQTRGYVMTIAIVADTDDSQALERNEMEKVVQTLIREAGRVQAAIIINAETELGFRTGDVPIPMGDAAVDRALHAMDENNDEIIALNEMEALYRRRRFQWTLDDVRGYFQEADENSDNKLDGQEIGKWIKKLVVNGPYYAKRLFGYARLKELVGEELANAWLDYRY